jgi:RNA polymerase sigma-70 factor
MEESFKREDLLHRAWETARQPWPQLAVPADVFVRHLTRLLPESSEERLLGPLIEQLVLADLYLACACVNHIPESIETLERHCLAKLPGRLGSLKLPTSTLDDVCQSVRIHLLLGTAQAGPRLAEYTGRGTLLSWIQVIATRMALRQGASARETPDENVAAAIEAMPAPGLDADLDLIKRRYHREFQQAVREAFATLPGEQRQLLRLHFIDGLSTTAMAPLFGVNQSTISRKLKSARQVIYEETKLRLQACLGLSSREFTSLMEVIESQLDLSLSQFLKAGD